MMNCIRYFASACLCLVPSLAIAHTGERPNILLLLADDLGYSDLGCFGGEIDTPTLDNLAAGGIRLTHFYTTGRCCPSRAALLTGKYPHRVGLGHMAGNDLGQPGYRGRLSDEAITMADHLGKAGYRTFMSGKWHLGTPDPTKHGFEQFYGTLVSAKRFFDPDHFLRLPRDQTARTYVEGSFYGTDAVTDHALDFLEMSRQTPDQPFFLYIAYNAPHFPLQAPKELIDKYADKYKSGWDSLRRDRLKKMKQLKIIPGQTTLSKRSTWTNYGETKTGTNPAWDVLSGKRRKDLSRRMAIYAAMVDRMDQQIGRVIKSLRDNGELSNTLIIFTSDNGACFEWDPFGFDISSSNQNILHEDDDLNVMGTTGTFHSVGSGWANASNTPWRMYKHYNHEGGITSPAILHWPKGLDVPGGTIKTLPAHLIDIYPTVLTASGTQNPSAQGLLGTDLLKMLHHPPQKRMLFFEHQGNRAVRHGKWKLVAFDDGPWELYDLSIDRTESFDLAAKFPQKVLELDHAWNEWGKRNHVTPIPKDLRVKYLKPD